MRISPDSFLMPFEADMDNSSRFLRVLFEREEEDDDDDDDCDDNAEEMDVEVDVDVEEQFESVEFSDEDVETIFCRLFEVLFLVFISFSISM